MLRRRNSAWRRLARQFVCAGAVYPSPVFCWPTFGSSIVYSLVLIFCSSIWGSPLAAAPRRDKDNDKEKDTSQPLTVRWSEQQPGCTFSPGDDGKYRYGLWSGDVGIVLAVDAREMQIIRHRIEPIFGVLLEIHYRGAGNLEASPEGITLQFMKHFKVVQGALDPDSYTQKIQADADALDDETRREVAKHPERKQAREARLQDYQKSVNELIEFLSRNALRTAHLDRATPEVSGWVFFNTRNKWLGGWKSQEEFVLRLPLDGKVFEFPFKLPPKQGELLLRKRE
jgi:hypothetical protein